MQVLPHAGAQLCLQGHLQEDVHGRARQEQGVLEVLRREPGGRRRRRRNLALHRLPARLCQDPAGRRRGQGCGRPRVQGTERTNVGLAENFG